MRTCSALVVLLFVLTFSACGKPQPAANNAPAPEAVPGGDEPKAEAAPAAIPTTNEIQRRDASSVKLGDYLPPLDGGTIELAIPDGWKPLSSNSKFVMRFVELESRGGLPQIDVVVEENNLGGFTDVTEANVVEFTAAVAKDLEAKRTAVTEAPIPMIIGSVPCARYVSRLKLKIGEGTLLVERQTLVLLHAGRLYEIKLLVEIGKLVESRDAAYAVCAGVRFPTAASPAAESPVAE
ncbi:MAG: hypothetical protein ABI614_08455 [Planctomycetota bacterium]